MASKSLCSGLQENERNSPRNFRDKSRKQLLNIAKRLNKIERNMYVSVSFSERWRRAVESGDYYLEIPNEIKHKYNDHYEYGSIYRL